jgi:hypothetical protein
MYIAFELNNFCIMTDMANYAALNKIMSDFAVDSHPVPELDLMYQPHAVLFLLVFLSKEDTAASSTYPYKLKQGKLVWDRLCVKQSIDINALYLLLVTEQMFLIKQIGEHISEDTSSARLMDDLKLSFVPIR